MRGRPATKKKPDLRTASIALGRGLLVFVIPLLFLVQKWGGLVAVLLSIVFFGLRVYAAGRRFGGKTPSDRRSPKRSL
jgi:cobalamin synthase